MYRKVVKQRILAIFFVVLIVLLIPIKTKTGTFSSCNITICKAVLYSVVRVEFSGFTRTKFYFFPSNIDTNNNFHVLMDTIDDSKGLFEDLF